MNELPFWVEADRAVKDYPRVIGYSVHTINAAGGRERVRSFAIARKGGADVALHLANILRDELNAEAAK